MFKAIGEYMIVEPYRANIGDLILPDNAEWGKGDTFIVKDIGDGWYTDSGALVKFDIQTGDRVVVAGKILTINTGDSKFLIARQADVLAVEKITIREEANDRRN
jgi:co-chaperonin GroES (HSP10)